MRVIGLGWEVASTHWSNNDKNFTQEELESHLKMIVSKQRSRSIPTKAPVFLSVQEALPQLGTQSPDIVAMDSDRLETNDEFKKQARHKILERELVGFSDRHSNMQPT